MILNEITFTKISALFAGLSVTSGIVFAFTDAVAISAITSSAAVLMAGVSAYFGYKAKKLSEETKHVSEETKAVAVGTHDAVNARLDKLMKIVEEKFFAEGKEEGKQEAKAFSDAADKIRAETRQDLQK